MTPYSFTFVSRKIVISGLFYALATTIAIPLTANAANHVVDSSLDEQDGNTTTGNYSLREAIANAVDGDIITFDSKTFPATGKTTITFILGTMNIVNSITIDGDSRVTLDGNHDTQMFNISSLSASTKHVNLQNITFENAFAESLGGTIHNQENLTVNNCIFSNNTSMIGGAIYSLEPYDNPHNNLTTITNSHFTGNGMCPDTAVTGRLLSGGALRLSYTNAEISNCEFTDNCTGDNGGAIATYNSRLEITDSSFSGNRASIDRTGCGGAMYLSGSTLTLDNVSMEANTAAGAGGAMQLVSTPLTVKNSIFSNNIAEFGSGGVLDTTGPDTSIVMTDTVISGNSSSVKNGGGLNIINGATLDCSLCTLTDNSASGNGGAVFCAWSGSSATISNSVFSGNSATNGGAISTDDANIDCTECTMNNNYATQRGGVIFNDTSSDATITNSTITGNNCDLWGGVVFNEGLLTLDQSSMSSNMANEVGGAVLNANFDTSGAHMTIVNSVLNNNRSSYGGAISNMLDGSILTIDSCTVSANDADNYGGGAYNSDQAEMTVLNSTFSANNATEYGGGIISLASGIVNLQNSTVSGNYTSIDGGGIYNESTIYLTNTTCADNAADGLGGGIYSESIVNLQSSILAENSSDDIHILNPADLIASYSLIENDNSTTLLDGVDNNIVGRPAILLPLEDNGGRTFTHALQTGSSAIDSGSNPNGLLTDQRGTGFLRLAGGAVDMGSFEYQDVYDLADIDQDHDVDGLDIVAVAKAGSPSIQTLASEFGNSK